MTEGHHCGSLPTLGGAKFLAVVAQLVERVLGKDEVTSSILVNGSRVIGACGRASVAEGHQFNPGQRLQSYRSLR